METAVLHPQDHLAQERYGYHSRMMSGMIYPLGGLPRTRRKVKTPSQVFAASIQSDNVRVSSNQNVHAVDTSNGPSDLTFGVLRGARFSSSPSSRHSSGLSAPQYRLLTTPKSESARSEATTSPVKPKQHVAGSPFSSSSLVFNGGSTSTTCPAPVARTRSDGELLSVKKGGEVDKTADRRRSSFEKSSENNKNVFERKAATDKSVVEKVEKPIERRKSFDKKPQAEKKVYRNQDDKPVTSAPKKGVIMILQRPQTKEAAVENLSKIIGIPVESLQALKPNRTPPQQGSTTEVTRSKDVDLGSSAVAADEGQEVVGSPKGSESGSSYTSRGRPGSPKGGKKKSVRADSNRASGFREKVGKMIPSGSNNNNNNSAYSARVYVEKEEKNKTEDREVVSPASSESSTEDTGATKTFLLSRGLLNLSPEDYSAAQSLSSVQLKKSSARSIITAPEGVHKTHDEHGIKHGSPRSDTSREIHRRSESCDLICLPSSPPTAAAERWAGPAYTNSPPPSNLPFPTFPTQRAKSSLVGMSLVGLVDPLVPDVVPMKASSAPSSPTRVSSVFFSERRTESRVDSSASAAAAAARVDPFSATKDLRRILNLDIECAAGAEAEVSPVPVDSFLVTSSLQVEEQLSATQSLKRILQLG